MIAMKLKNTKNFMSHLLLSDTFDHFLFIEGKIITFLTFTIDGYIQKEFYESGAEIPEEYAFWKQLREQCFSIIKGKQTPLEFKLVFRLSSPNTEKLLAQQDLDFQAGDVQGLYLNIRFERGSLQCITGTSLKTFSMDKSLEQAWDKMVQRFFEKKEIDYELE